MLNYPGISLWLLSHHRSVLSICGVVQMPLYRSMALSLAHHQVLVLQSQTPTQKVRVLLCETIVMKCHCGQKCDGRKMLCSGNYWTELLGYLPSSFSRAPQTFVLILLTCMLFLLHTFVLPLDHIKALMDIHHCIARS